MDWLEISVFTTANDLNALCARLGDLGVEGLIIDGEAAVDDYLQNARHPWEYLDEEVIAKSRGVNTVRFYLEDSDKAREKLERYRRARPDHAIAVKRVRDEDWENNWRQYYKPIAVGEKLLIVPAWETASAPGSRIILRLEPKNVFGNGSHASTRMCLEELEAHAGHSVLDLGCGSGILSIAAILLGFCNGVGCDIVPESPKIARENADLNGIGPDRLRFYCGDVLSDAFLRDVTEGRRFDVVLANIVADVIEELIPRAARYLSNAGVFICSGIIDTRESELQNALAQGGFSVISSRKMDNWRCFAARRRGADVLKSPVSELP